MEGRRTGVLIGFLAALVIGLGAALAVVLIGDDDGESPTTSATAPITAATQRPETTLTTTPPTVPTQTSPAAATIDQVQAKAAARQGAATAVVRFGATIPADQWDARCTAVGGAAQAATWRCQVAANDGACAGPIVAYARAPAVAATRDERIGCGG